MINTSVEINDRHSAFRYPRGNGLGVQLPHLNDILEIGKARIIKEVLHLSTFVTAFIK